MTVELRPLGVKCNLQCTYCYQNPQRDAGNIAKQYDMDAMRASVEREGGPFTLFGGEALMIPRDDLEELWSWGYVRWGKNSVQTNGVLVRDEHIRLFKKYKVHVGVSIDGPSELNALRSAGSAEKTRRATAKSEQTIQKLCRQGIPPSLIVTLHKKNATPDKLPIMEDWFQGLDALGVRSVRLHILEAENQLIRENYALSQEENIQAFRAFAKLQGRLSSMRFDIFADMKKQLVGDDDRTTCVWNACDPYTTRAVRGIEGSGASSNCGRTNKDGIDFLKSDLPGFERYIALYWTPQEYGGCHGCRFFLMCKGQCPGTAILGDWRNRTEYCGVWKALYRDAEKEVRDAGTSPISMKENLREKLEAAFLGAWSRGDNPSMAYFLRNWKDKTRSNKPSSGSRTLTSPTES